MGNPIIPDEKVFPIVSMFVYFLSFGQEVEISRSTIFKDQKKRTFLSYALEDSQGGTCDHQEVLQFYNGFGSWRILYSIF